MKLVKRKGRKAFVKNPVDGDVLIDQSEIEAAIQRDFEIRRAKENAATREDALAVDDADQIDGEDGPIYGAAKLGEIAPMLARSARWQSAAELKAIEAFRAARASNRDDRGDGRDEPRDTGSER